MRIPRGVAQRAAKTRMAADAGVKRHSIGVVKREGAIQPVSGEAVCDRERESERILLSRVLVVGQAEGAGLRSGQGDLAQAVTQKAMLLHRIALTLMYQRVIR